MSVSEVIVKTDDDEGVYVGVLPISQTLILRLVNADSAVLTRNEAIRLAAALQSLAANLKEVS